MNLTPGTRVEIGIGAMRTMMNWCGCNNSFARSFLISMQTASITSLARCGWAKGGTAVSLGTISKRQLQFPGSCSDGCGTHPVVCQCHVA